MSSLETKIPTDRWERATWEDYIKAAGNSGYEQARFYYHRGKLCIEMTPIGSFHSRDNTIITLVVSLFCSFKGIPANGLTNCSYRKEGVVECQPDISYYLGDKANLTPLNNSVIDLQTYPTPDLVVEIASTSLSDDLGTKRLLYEDLNVTEYWVVDVQNTHVIAFIISESGSKRITQSQVLPGLAISLVEEALQRSHQSNQSQVINWLLTQLQISS
jgi:Uma2 family endonuclease